MSFNGLFGSKGKIEIKKTRVSLFVHDLPGNPIVRAAPIGLALERLGFETEVLGVLAEDQQLYAPYADAFEFKTAPRIRDLPELATGDIVYSFKPHQTTLLPAMNAAGFGFRKPILLDIEDDDLGVCEQSKTMRFLRASRNCARSPVSLMSVFTHLTRVRCETVTVSTTLLQKFYGGTKLLHGPDEKQFDPSIMDQDRAKLRESFGLPNDKLLVLFAGKPRAHKGIAEIIEAVDKTKSVLVLAGDRQDPLFMKAKEQLGSKCLLIGFVNYRQMPGLLSAVDIIPVPQHDVAYARAQLPAKLIEAMAMGKSVVVSDVGDLPLLVGANSDHVGGWVVHPNDAEGLAEAIDAISASPSLVQQRSANARKFYEENASVSANARILQSIFESRKRLRRFL